MAWTMCVGKWFLFQFEIIRRYSLLDKLFTLKFNVDKCLFWEAFCVRLRSLGEFVNWKNEHIFMFGRSLWIQSRLFRIHWFVSMMDWNWPPNMLRIFFFWKIQLASLAVRDAQYRNYYYYYYYLELLTESAAPLESNAEGNIESFMEYFNYSN